MTTTRVLCSSLPGYVYLVPVRKESDIIRVKAVKGESVIFSEVQFNYDFRNPVIIICNILTIFEVYKSARTFFIWWYPQLFSLWV